MGVFFSPGLPQLLPGPLIMLAGQPPQSVGTLFDNESDTIAVTEGIQFDDRHGE
jgi:hypothetical protein